MQSAFTTAPATDRGDLPPQLPLLGCPWCGHVPLLQAALHHGFFVLCDGPSCPVVPPETRSHDTREQAAQAWNGRA